jgi:hypothetical protein
MVSIILIGVLQPIVLVSCENKEDLRSGQQESDISLGGGKRVRMMEDRGGEIPSSFVVI